VTHRQGTVGLGRASERLSRAPATRELELDSDTLLATPERPDHRFGNRLLIHPDSPVAAMASALVRYGEVARRLDLPAEPCASVELSLNRPTYAYLQMAWAREATVVVDDVLLLERESLPDGANRLTVRPLEADEWDAVARCAVPQDGFVESGLRTWLLRQRRARVERGGGTFFGGWFQGRLVASCGLFHDPAVGRLDQLLVTPDSRGMGFGSEMIVEVSRRAPNVPLVMEPLRGDWRSAMYQRLGYRPVSTTVTVIAESFRESQADDGPPASARS